MLKLNINAQRRAMARLYVFKKVYAKTIDKIY